MRQKERELATQFSSESLRRRKRRSNGAEIIFKGACEFPQTDETQESSLPGNPMNDKQHKCRVTCTLTSQRSCREPKNPKITYMGIKRLSADISRTTEAQKQGK